MEKFHVLIVRFSSLGDVILTTSLPKALKDRYGDKIHLSYLTSREYAPLLEGVPWLDSLHFIERVRGWKGPLAPLAAVKKIKAQRPIDLLIDMHGTLRSLLIRFLSPDLPRLFVDKRTLERWILTSLRVDFLSTQGPQGRAKGFGEPILERLVRDFGEIFDLPGPLQRPLSSCAQSFTPTQIPWHKWGITRPPGRYICFAPSASFPEKRWPVERFVGLVENLCQNLEYKDYAFVVLAGPQDDFCRQFDPLVTKWPERVFNLQGKTNLVESTILVKEAAFCVGNDTGIPHIAESVGTPVVAILGPTGEAFGYYPHLAPSRTVLKKIWCRPCTTAGKGHCIRKERYCLTQIQVADVLAQMGELKKELTG